MLNTSWDQGSPYNNHAPLKKKKRALAGCAAIAIAQVMAHHRYPNQIQDLSLDWKSILEPVYGAQPFASPMIRKVGDILKNDWGHKGTSAKPQNLPTTLRTIGYNASDLQGYDEQWIIKDLKENRPLIFGGYRSTNKFIGITMSYRHGHAWVVDGAIAHERYRDKLSTSGSIEKETDRRLYLHCCWGWYHGKYNGYFLTHLFDPGKNVTDPQASPLTRGTNYNKRLRIIYDIKPNP